MTPTLITISFSHYCEKARWALDRCGIEFRERANLPLFAVSVEYALIRDVNDQPWRADLLAKRLHRALGPLVHVNLIPLNPTPGSEWDASPKPGSGSSSGGSGGRSALHRARHPRP